MYIHSALIYNHHLSSIIMYVNTFILYSLSISNNGLLVSNSRRDHIRNDNCIAGVGKIAWFWFMVFNATP